MTSTDKLSHAVAATKELIAIVMALAAANAVSQFILAHGCLDPSRCGVTLYVLLIGMLFAIVRFYHGNVLSIGHHFAEGHMPESIRQGVTFFVIVAQSFIFASSEGFVGDLTAQRLGWLRKR